MKDINLFRYSGNIFKKSLELYIHNLKIKISEHLKENDLKSVKKTISEIEYIRKLQNEIDSIIVSFNNQFSEEIAPRSENKINIIKQKEFKHYTLEILSVLNSYEMIDLFDLKTILYNGIVSHIYQKDITTNNNYPYLLNWEVNFYKTISLLFKNEFIQFDDGNPFMIKISEKGKTFYEPDTNYFESFEDEEINTNILELIDKDPDKDFISSLRSYLLSDLIANHILLDDEDPDFYENMFFIIKKLYSIDGLEIEKWEQIKENNFYKVISYFNPIEKVVFIKEKFHGYNVLECIEEDNSRTLFAFI